VAASPVHQVHPHLQNQLLLHVAAALVADAIAATTVMAMQMATCLDMAMAMAIRLVTVVTMNLTVSPGKMSAKPAEVSKVAGNQVMFVMRMATCKSAARNSQHTQVTTTATAVSMKLAAAHLEQSSRSVNCGSMCVVTSLAIVSK